MPRHETHGGSPYTKQLNLKVNQEMLTLIDKNRGAMSRSKFMREVFRSWMLDHGVAEQPRKRMIVKRDAS
jgi:hypothetical protein